MRCRPDVARKHESWGAPTVYLRVRRIAGVNVDRVCRSRLPISPLLLAGDWHFGDLAAVRWVL